MGGRAQLRATMRHFFNHLGVPELGNDQLGSLIESVERDMRRAGQLSRDQAIWIGARNIDDIEIENPEIGASKRAQANRQE